MIQSMGVIWAMEGTRARLPARLPSRLALPLSGLAPERRRRVLRRGLPTLLVLLGLLVGFTALVCGGESADERAARQFT
jgi:hypothetical protein